MNVDAVDHTGSRQITQAIQRRTNKRGSAVSVIDKLPFHRNGCAVARSALGEHSELTFNRVRGRLLFAGDARVNRGLNDVHSYLPSGRFGFQI